MLGIPLAAQEFTPANDGGSHPECHPVLGRRGLTVGPAISKRFFFIVGKTMSCPLVMTNIVNGPCIDFLPCFTYEHGDFPVRYVNVYQRVCHPSMGDLQDPN
jgi:hypothetical protein